MRKKLQKWLVGIILNGQNLEADCFVCQHKIRELERRINVAETKQARLKTKVYHFLKEAKN